MTGICRDAEKRLRRLADDAAEEFDTTLLHNRVHEQVEGQHTRDDTLAALLDAAELAYDLWEVFDGDSASVTFDAAETLNSQVDALVAGRVAEACAVIVTEADDWTDAWDANEIHRAQAEARGWLADHPDAAERAGILEDAREADVAEVTADD